MALTKRTLEKLYPAPIDVKLYNGKWCCKAGCGHTVENKPEE